MCDREAVTTRGCHLGYTDTLMKPLNLIGPGVFFLILISQFLACTHMIRRPCWCTKSKSKMLRTFCIIIEPNSQKTFRYCSLHQHGRQVKARDR